ncbi:MAG: hypothetical protein ACE5MM_08270 [Nitrospiraceae bacterium]
MGLFKKGLAFVGAMAVVVGMVSTALAIEAFQERFEWGDMSKPTTIQGRVIVLDPYDKAVWINTAVFGGNAESGYWWQTTHPGKNLKFYAKDEKVWKQLKAMARPGAGPAAAKQVPPATAATLIEFVATEPEQNHRVIHSLKKIKEIVGTPDKTISIMALFAGCADETSAKCYKAKQKVATAPKAVPRQAYDVMIPGGTPVGGLTPWSPDYNSGK